MCLVAPPSLSSNPSTHLFFPPLPFRCKQNVFQVLQKMPDCRKWVLAHVWWDKRASDWGVLTFEGRQIFLDKQLGAAILGPLDFIPHYIAVMVATVLQQRLALCSSLLRQAYRLSRQKKHSLASPFAHANWPICLNLYRFNWLRCTVHRK